jgi:hypothetical protein
MKMSTMKQSANEQIRVDDLSAREDVRGGADPVKFADKSGNTGDPRLHIA